MAANWKTILFYCVTWYALGLPGRLLVPMSYCALHGGSAGHTFVSLIHHPWRPSDGLTMLVYILVHYLIVIRISFRTLDVRAIKPSVDPLARVLFVSGEVGLGFYLLYLLGAWHHRGAWSLVAGLPSLLATVGAGYALRFVWPHPPQPQAVPTPTEGVWPPPPNVH